MALEIRTLHLNPVFVTYLLYSFKEFTRFYRHHYITYEIKVIMFIQRQKYPSTTAKFLNICESVCQKNANEKSSFLF